MDRQYGFPQPKVAHLACGRQFGLVQTVQFRQPVRSPGLKARSLNRILKFGLLSEIWEKYFLGKIAFFIVREIFNGILKFELLNDFCKIEKNP